MALNFIMSQHMGECVMDTLQNIFYFADTFREKFASIAEAIFDRFGKKILEFDEEMIEYTLKRFDINLDNNLDEDEIQFIKSFFEKTLRRYNFIKLQEKHTNSNILNEILDCGSVTSELPGRLEHLTYHKSQRRQSLDKNLGINILHDAKKFLSVQKNKKNYIAGVSDELENEIFRVLKSALPFFQEDIIIKNQYFLNTRKGLRCSDIGDIDKLVAIKYTIDCRDKESAHAVAIIKNNGDYYLMDNNIGKAVKCYNNDEDKKSFMDNLNSGLRLVYYYDRYPGYFIGGHKIIMPSDIDISYVAPTCTYTTERTAKFFYKK